MPEGPTATTIEAWCLELLLDRGTKLCFRPPATESASWETSPRARRIERPGRAAHLRTTSRSPRTPRPSALREISARAKLVHTFLHHEIQAAELFAWAVLAFPETPRTFRAGLVRLCGEELVHARLYEDHLGRLGARYGDYAVRDWFWERGRAHDPLQFVAFQGLGLEGANLEHSARFGEAFRAAGDEEGARILDRVGREEIAHVAFARRWFETFSGAPLSYANWAQALPAPLSPSVLRGVPLNLPARRAAGFDDAFLDALAAAPPTTRRSDAAEVQDNDATTKPSSAVRP